MLELLTTKTNGACPCSCVTDPKGRLILYVSQCPLKQNRVTILIFRESFCELVIDRYKRNDGSGLKIRRYVNFAPLFFCRLDQGHFNTVIKLCQNLWTAEFAKCHPLWWKKLQIDSKVDVSVSRVKLKRRICTSRMDHWKSASCTCKATKCRYKSRIRPSID